ncbi:MAG: hypothetical protein COB06_006055, partial [Pseudomonas sp.]|nr:hypothetical protein [Pseudomonas sp.]
MNTRGLLDQLLKSGQDMLQNKASGQRKSDDKGALGGLLGGGGLGQLWGPTTREECVALAREAIDSGITLLDMAP